MSPLTRTRRSFAYHGTAPPCADLSPLARSSPVHFSSLELSLLTWGSFRFDNERWRNLLRTWFTRAKGSPLSLGLNFQCRMASTALLDLVSSHASQIQRLDLHMEPEQFQKFRPFLTPFPLLQHLATTHSDSEDVRNLLIASPLIRELYLLCDSELDFLVDQSLPFLTHLEVTTITAEMFLAILRNFPALSHLKCFYDRHSFLIPDASTPITFPHLSSFHTNGSSILPLVAFPSLCFLEIGCDAEADVVQEFISRSSCTIHHLVMSFENEDADNIADWLSIFPSISVLKVTECPKIALLPLIDYLSSPTLMPWLTDISICSDIMSSNIESDCYDALFKMLHYRHPLQAAILRRFHIKLTSSSNQVDCSQMWRPGHLTAQALEQLLEDGLDFGFSVECEDVEIPVWPAAYVLEPEPDFPTISKNHIQFQLWDKIDPPLGDMVWQRHGMREDKHKYVCTAPTAQYNINGAGRETRLRNAPTAPRVRNGCPRRQEARSGAWDHGKRNSVESDLDAWAVASHNEGSGEVREADHRTTQRSLAPQRSASDEPESMDPPPPQGAMRTEDEEDRVIASEASNSSFHVTAQGGPGHQLTPHVWAPSVITSSSKNRARTSLQLHVQRLLVKGRK
ncbi:hypothetical protein GGX14DRAFT_658507 [Mycena pura]|uniref:F-box domain-containing protein n=1 Tax=Mycena pura TaxID=153505 RepID=A0AAD6YMA0_9AGAR|nr:hypothetical protein GGX14DRAFT_658507 [Mycena pura]